MSGKPVAPEKRFWPKVDKNGHVPANRPELGPCWIWTASTWSGYGIFHVGPHRECAHRWAYAQRFGPIPEGLELDHLCRTPACVNPRHLEPVTSRENTMRGENFAAKNAQKTHCSKGHEFTAENTHYPPSGGRVCRACRRISVRQAKARHRSNQMATSRDEAFSLARRVVGRMAERDDDAARTQRLLDEAEAAMLDDLQDAIVGPVRIDAEQLEAWCESRARDFDVTDEIPF